MSLREFTFGIGDTFQKVCLPEEHISDVMEGKSVPAVDIKKATIDCMRNPISSDPLQKKVTPGDSVCLVVADCTRIWNQSNKFLVYIINELNLAGIPDTDICIVFAQGSHRAHTPEENIKVCGEEVCRRIKMYQHDCNDTTLVDLGKTKIGTPLFINKHVVDADKVIIVDGITVHLFAGYGGGRKLILPGVSGYKTIQCNHCHALAPQIGEGVNPLTRPTLLDHNPLNDDMIEACAKINPCFLVHSIINAEGEICRMVGGDWYDAWLEGTKEVHRIQQVPMKQKTDVVFACAGGYPKDVSLYQGSKCYDPAEMAVKDGGIVIAIMEARDIKEPPAYMDSFCFDTMEEMEKALRAEFTIPFFVAYNLFCLCHRCTVILVTRPENFEDIRRTGQIPVATVKEAWLLAQKKLEEQKKNDYTINIMTHCTTVVPTLAQ
ncbi:Nickel-dependent lactate racemase [Megasphaera paucivorans]|uniref:Nickel-dependent lactate racemase n=1 Tax=Megasphaera paucivorans TaxID=349095 RepID=A0A1G9ZBS8_9FIRM|nr:nickel-dependent lactate racemase [Megasphaera paucivorans]SDN18872.1 Nickel-dependent lactate racemase [Megasphaera paucivorans]